MFRRNPSSGNSEYRVEYRKNEEENIVGFVQNGQLWSYDAAQNKLSLVFGFREGDDLRGSFDEHAIRILNVDESGSMNFLVYGYMNGAAMRARRESRSTPTTPWPIRWRSGFL